MIIPFSPGGATASISATTSSSRVVLNRAGAFQVMVTAPADNAVIAFIRFGTSTVAATTTDTPILPGTVQVFTIANSATNVAAITGSSSATLYFTPGDGQ